MIDRPASSPGFLASSKLQARCRFPPADLTYISGGVTRTLAIDIYRSDIYRSVTDADESFNEPGDGTSRHIAAIHWIERR